MKAYGKWLFIPTYSWSCQWLEVNGQFSHLARFITGTHWVGGSANIIRRTLIIIIFMFVLKDPKIRRPFCSGEQYFGGGANAMYTYVSFQTVRVTLRLAVCRQSVRLGANHETHGQIFFLQLNPCGLMIGRVCLLWICFAIVKFRYQT
jgi:hypothetical protein